MLAGVIGMIVAVCNLCARFYIEVGRLLRSKEGYQGYAEEIADMVGLFDAKLREARPSALAATLGSPLPVAGVVCCHITKRLHLNLKLASFTMHGNILPQHAPEADLQTNVTPWAHDLNSCGAASAEYARVLTVLAIVASHMALPGSIDLEVMHACSVVAGTWYSSNS